MRVLDIELKNYRKFKQFRCEFHPRFTLLAGENGSGKTSLMKGLNGGVFAYIKSYMNVANHFLDITDAHQTKTEDISSEQWNVRNYPCSSSSRVQLSAPLSMPEGKDVGGYGYTINSEINSTLLETASVTTQYLKNQFQEYFKASYTLAIPIIYSISAEKLSASNAGFNPTKPFSKKQDIYSNENLQSATPSVISSWFYHYSLRKLQENTEPLIYRKVKEAVINAIHASDIDFLVRDGFLAVKYKDKGWHPLNDLSDGQQRIAGIFCDLAMRCASLNSHLGEDCITATTGVVTIDELDLHLHPKWQKQVVGDLLRTFPNIQFIATSHSPFLLQAAFEHGAVVDMATGQFMQAQDLSIEDISEHNMGVQNVQRGQRFVEMKIAAKQYYDILEKIPNASESEKKSIKQKLDDLLIPYSNDPAYAAWLEMHRHAAEL
jgi:predicted ATP-binding protein involved in virulence